MDAHNHETQTIRVTVEVPKRLHARIVAEKYSRDSSDKVTIEKLVVDAIARAYPDNGDPSIRII